MPSVSTSALQEIKQCAIPVHRSLYSVENMWKSIRHNMPQCYRDAMEQSLKDLHGSLSAQRDCVLEHLPIDPLTDDEIVALGGAGTKP